MFTAGGVIYDAQGNPVGKAPQAANAPSGQGFLQDYLTRGKEAVGKAGEKISQTVGELGTKYPQAGRYTRMGAAALGSIPAVGASLNEIQEGRPLGAVAALAPVGLSAIGAGMIGKGGVAGTAVGLGLMGLGAILPGAAASGAESVRQKATGEPTKGKEGEFSTQMAMARQMGELGATQYRDQMGTYTSAIRDLQRDISNQQYLDLQRNIPLIEKMKNNDLIRQQALMNTQGQQYAMLGTVSTASQLATGAQAQTGETLRTALTSNPYAGATLQAPQIRF